MNSLMSGIGRNALLAQDEILRGIRKGLNAEPAMGQWLILGLAAAGLFTILILAKRFFAQDIITKPPPQTDYLAEAGGRPGVHPDPARRPATPDGAYAATATCGDTALSEQSRVRLRADRRERTRRRPAATIGRVVTAVIWRPPTNAGGGDDDRIACAAVVT